MATPNSDPVEDFEVGSKPPPSDSPPKPAPLPADKSPKPAKPAGKPDSAISVALPKSFADALKEQARIQSLPEKTELERAAKEKALARISRHCFEIQQGTVAMAPTTLNDMDTFKAQTKHAYTVQIESLARQHPVVRELAQSLDAAKARIEELEASFAKK